MWTAVLLILGTTACLQNAASRPEDKAPGRSLMKNVSSEAQNKQSGRATHPGGPGLGNTYYVAPHGDNSAAGTRDQPWRTLDHAATRLGPGDTLIVAPGHYAGFTLYEQSSGTTDARVRILAEDGAVIDSVRGDDRDGINIEGASFIDIEGFIITGAPRAGIRAVECEQVHIRNNKTRDNGTWGIFTGFCDNLLVENNIASGSRREHGIYISNSAKNPVIRGNRIFANARSGIHTNGDAGEGREGMTSGALIENNLIYDNGRQGGAAINNDGIRDSIIRNNIIYNNHANGISLYRIDGRSPSRNNQILHNTIVMPRGEARWCLRVADASTDNLFKNNICINGHGHRGAIDISVNSLPGFASDHNLIDPRFTLLDGDMVIDLDRWRTMTGLDTGSIAASYDDLDRIFVAPARADWHLAPGSPAIDRGEPHLGVDMDYSGHERSLEHPDIGALEHCFGGVCTPPARRVAPPPRMLDSTRRSGNNAAPTQTARRLRAASTPAIVAHRIVVRVLGSLVRHLPLPGDTVPGDTGVEPDVQARE